MEGLSVWPPSSGTAPSEANSSAIPSPDTTASTPQVAAAAAAVAEPARALGHLQAHVGDVEPRHRGGAVEQAAWPARESRCGRGPCSVCASPTTSTESPIASRRSIHGAGLELLAGDREVRAVAVARRVVVRVGDARRRVVLDRRRRVAAQRRHDAGEHHDEPVAAGVDHARLAQDRQQVGAALDRLLALVEGALEQLGQHRVLLVGHRVERQPRLRHVRELGRDPVRHLAHHGEDRALRGAAHGAVGAVGRARHRGADQDRIDELAGARDQLLGGAADQLREDDAGVAAGAQQRSAGDGLDDLVAADLVQRALVLGEPVELVEHGAQRERHVVAGVAVGDREDVEVVDLLTASFEFAEGPLDDGAEAEKAGIRHGEAARQPRPW